MAQLKVTKRIDPNSNGWEERHNLAASRVFQPYPWTDTQENAVAMLLNSWANYANSYKEFYGGDLIGSDGVLGPEWQHIGECIRGLLNGETGRLDGGTCDAFILNTLSENGIDTSLL